MTASPKDNYIVSGSMKDIKIWNLYTNECVDTIEAHQDWVTCLCFSPDGDILLTGDYIFLNNWIR